MSQVEEIGAGLPGRDEIQTSLLDGTTFPIVAEPRRDLDPCDWGAGSHDFIEACLQSAGAILFRGFNLPEIADFERFAASMCTSLYGDYGDLPHQPMGEKIYESTPYPPDKAILFHNEASHTPCWPRKQMFFSVIVAKERGETPIVDCRKIYQALDPAVAERFREKGLSYVRNFIPGLDVDWKDFFKTEDKAEVEARCKEEGMEAEWTAEGLRVRQKAPAVIRHPITGEFSFFNQIQLHHVQHLDPELKETLMMLYGEDGLPRNVYYGDGTPIENDLIQELEQMYWDQSVQFQWQERDVIMVDNMMIAHARNPFVGPRKIAVAMGDMVRIGDLQ